MPNGDASNACGSRYGDGTWGKVGGKHAGGTKGKGKGKDGGKSKGKGRSGVFDQGKGQGRSGVGVFDRQGNKLPQWYCHQCQIQNRPWRTECMVCGKMAPSKYLNQGPPRKNGGKVGGGKGGQAAGGKSGGRDKDKELLELQAKVAKLEKEKRAGFKGMGKGFGKGKAKQDPNNDGDELDYLEFDEDEDEDFEDGDGEGYDWDDDEFEEMDEDETIETQLVEKREQRRLRTKVYKDTLGLAFPGRKNADISEEEILGSEAASLHKKIKELDADIIRLQGQKREEQPMGARIRNAKSDVEATEASLSKSQHILEGLVQKEIPDIKALLTRKQKELAGREDIIRAQTVKHDKAKDVLVELQAMEKAQRQGGAAPAAPAAAPAAAACTGAESQQAMEEHVRSFIRTMHSNEGSLSFMEATCGQIRQELAAAAAARDAAAASSAAAAATAAAAAAARTTDGEAGTGAGATGGSQRQRQRSPAATPLPEERADGGSRSPRGRTTTKKKDKGGLEA